MNSRIADNWDGEYYQQHQRGQELSVFDVLGDVSFHGDERALDIGCGDGRLTAELARDLSRGKVVGIDYSLNMIQSARDRYGQIPNLSFFHVDAAQFTYEEPFDLIFSFRTLHWIEDQAVLYRNIKRLLKPEGKFIAQMAAKEHSTITTAFDTVCNQEKWAVYFTKKAETYFPQTTETIGGFLDQAGFQDQSVVLVSSDHTFENLDELVNWLMVWIPHCTGLPKGQDLSFARDTAEDLYEQKRSLSSQPITFEIFSLFIEAIS